MKTSNRIRWTVFALVTLTAGWMAFDGTKALVTGDYVTPRSGRHAGQLGPWSHLVSAVGIEPRSTTMKTIFVVYGFSTLTVMVLYLAGFSWGSWAMLVAAIMGLWYLPFGTAANLAVIVLILESRRRSGSAGG